VSIFFRSMHVPNMSSDRRVFSMGPSASHSNPSMLFMMYAAGTIIVLTFIAGGSMRSRHMLFTRHDRLLMPTGQNVLMPSTPMRAAMPLRTARTHLPRTDGPRSIGLLAPASSASPRLARLPHWMKSIGQSSVWSPLLFGNCVNQRGLLDTLIFSLDRNRISVSTTDRLLCTALD